MGQGTVNTKATTDEEIRALLKKTYAMDKPLGVPTLFLHKYNFANIGKNGIDHPGIILQQIKEQIETAPESFRQAYHQMQSTFGDQFVINLENHSLINLVLSTHASYAETLGKCQYINERFSRPAHHYNPEKFKDPTLAIIATPHAAQVPDRRYLQHALFFTAWHEIGHTVQGDEAHADAVATIMSKKNIDNTAFLKMAADKYAYSRAYWINDKSYKNYFSWHRTEGMDYFSALPQATLDKIGLKELRQLRFLKFQNDHPKTDKCLKHIFKQAGIQDPKDITLYSYETLTDKTTTLLQEWEDKKGTPEYCILQRFNLAVTRLAIGESAYYDESLEKQMYKDGYQPQFLPKNMPEFLPQP